MKRRGRPVGARGQAPALLFFSLSFFLSALCVGCDDGAPSRTPPLDAPAPPPSQTVAPGPSASTQEAPAASASAGMPASSASPAGAWEGRYDAKKGSVELPPKVKDKVRKKDEGQAATGPGTVSVTIDAEGELRGKAKGALGELTLVGRIEGDVVRASVTPDDPYAPHAMTGILVGRLEGEVIRANLRVAGPDAVLVRESPVELRRVN